MDLTRPLLTSFSGDSQTLTEAIFPLVSRGNKSSPLLNAIGYRPESNTNPNTAGRDLARFSCRLTPHPQGDGEFSTVCWWRTTPSQHSGLTNTFPHLSLVLIESSSICSRGPQGNLQKFIHLVLWIWDSTINVVKQLDLGLFFVINQFC